MFIVTAETDYEGTIYGKGDTREKALDNLLELDCDFQMHSVKLYKCEEIPCKVTNATRFVD